MSQTFTVVTVTDQFNPPNVDVTTTPIGPPGSIAYSQNTTTMYFSNGVSWVPFAAVPGAKITPS